MMSTVLVLGYGKPPDITHSITPGPHGPIAAVDIDDLRIQSSDPQELYRLADAIGTAARRLVLEPVAS